MRRDLHFLTIISSFTQTLWLLQQGHVLCPHPATLGICGISACRLPDICFLPKEVIPHHLKIPQSTFGWIPDSSAQTAAPQ